MCMDIVLLTEPSEFQVVRLVPHILGHIVVHCPFLLRSSRAFLVLFHLGRHIQHRCIDWLPLSIYQGRVGSQNQCTNAH